MTFNKIFITIKNFKETAYHHYGNSPESLMKFIYYSVFRINTFIVYENDLTKRLCDLNLDKDFKVVKPSIEELENIRKGMILPREFFYDRIYNAKTCYLAYKNDKIAYIHWVFFCGDYSRFLILREGVAELNYNTTMPEFRGQSLSAKMMAYISKDLQKKGYKKVMGVIHEYNYPSIKCIKKAGFVEIARIRTLGLIHRKMTV